jgi:hypothetical protein
MDYRKVKFEYFQVWLEKDSGEELFDLRSWMQVLMGTTSLEKRVAEYRGERARLEEAYFDPDFDYYFLHFVRLRATNIPSKAKIDSNVEPFELEDDEYLGEEVSALYDEDRHILMLQRNKFSLGPNGIEEYLNIMWPSDKEFIRLRPIGAPNSFVKAKKYSIHRRLNLRLANIVKARDQGIIDRLKSPLKKVIDSYGEFNAINAQVILTVGQGKEPQLDRDSVVAAIDDIESNPTLFAKAEIAVKDFDDGPVEVLDLFESKAHDYTTFALEVRASLNHYNVAEAMWRIYHPKNKNRQSEVKSYLRL